MQQYLELLERVLSEGRDRPDRTGTGTRGIFGAQVRFDLGAGFPLLTTKRMHWRSIAGELLWFLRGDTNTAWLKQNKITIWDEWADADGDLGPVYGAMWRSWPAPDGSAVDQVAELIENLRQRPHSRRHVVSAWNPALLPEEGRSPRENPALGRQALPPCHCLFQFHVEDGRLSCQLYQRSADLFLGVPFNIASYALLTELLARVVGLKAGEFIHTFGDLHLYLDHLDAARTQLAREPKNLPKLEISRELHSLTDLESLEIDDLRLVGYDPHPRIPARVSV